MGWMGDGYWRKEANESEAEGMSLDNFGMGREDNGKKNGDELLSMEDKEAASLERRRSLVGYVGESVQAWEGRG